MQVIDSIQMVSVTVKNMKKSKAFYEEMLGLKVIKDYREDDDNWWVNLEFPGGGAELTLGRAAKYGSDEAPCPGTIGLYFATSDVEAAHKELGKKGLKVGEVYDDLFGPGSGARFFTVDDPDGTTINIFQQA